MSSAPPTEDTRVRFNLRLHADTVERAKYWAEREDLSVNEYFALAIEEKIARANGDFDVPVLAIQRLNQMIDELRALSTNVTNLEVVTVSGFDSLLELTKGDSWLTDEEDGELSDIEPAMLGLDPEGAGNGPSDAL